MHKRPLLAGAALFAAAPAHAHGAFPGAGGFYSGLLHPFIAWEHLLLLVALGLALGGLRRDTAQMPLLCLALSLGAGLAFVSHGFVWPMATIGVLVLAILVGGALVLAIAIPVPVFAVIAAACGGTVGLDTDWPPAAVPSMVGIYAPYAGVYVGVFLIVLNAMACSSLLRRASLAIALRVMGSWIVAACLMVLVLNLMTLGGWA